MSDGTFYNAIGPILVLAQVFALFPVSGIKGKSANDLHFSWLSFRTIYSIIVIMLQVVIAFFIFYYGISRPVQFKTSEPLIFTATIIIISIKFLFLGRKWPELMRKWEKIECKLPQYTNQKEKSSLSYKLKMITCIGMIMSLTEHLLSMLGIIYFVNSCSADNINLIDDFLKRNLKQVFSLIEYSSWIGLLGKLLNIYSTFTWNFMDIFVMVMSVALSSRFKQLNESMLAIKGKNMPQAFWLEHRTNYRYLCILCDEVDNAISLITLFSFSNNLFFICAQLLRSIHVKPSLVHTVYFWFSLFFLLSRTLLISLYSAEINDQAKQPIKIFRCVPRESWCSEIKRFSEEVTSDVIALSGMKFFHITRGLVLSVAGTIVTYELVLIQFIDDVPSPPC